MFDLRKTLSILASMVAVLAITKLGFAAPATGGAPDAGAPVSCVAVEQRLAETRRTLETCEHRRQTAESDKAACTEELSSTSNKLDDVQGNEKTCRASKDALCTEAATFARQLLDGRVANVGSCVPSKEQMQLTALLRGWENSTSALNQIAAYGAGESDTLPALSGATAPERAVEKLLGKGGRREPAFYRRLLTEALRLSAPQAWQRVRTGGPGAIDTWFASTAPLEPKLVEEVDRAHATPNGQGGPPVSAALRLVQSYIFIAHCSDDVPTPACTRARQLQQLFESTGPLLVRRRIEEVWGTECHDAGPDRILSWVSDFPTPHITTRTNDYSDVATAAQAKLFTCYLEDAGAEPSFRVWLESKLPSPKKLTARTLARIDDIRSRARDGTPADTCGRAVRAMQDYAMPTACTAPSAEIRTPVERWSKIAATNGGDTDDVSLQICSMYARLLWEGRAATIPGSFERPPSTDEMVIVDVRVPETAFARLRRACQERHGEGEEVAESIHLLSQIARGFGEAPAAAPWRVDSATDTPIEKVRFGQANKFGSWMKHFFSRQSACQALGVSDARCQQCLELPRDSFYDCKLEVELDDVWAQRARTTLAVIIALALAFALVVWGLRLTRARRAFSTWALAARDRLGVLGLTSRPDPMRFVFPSYHDVLIVDLPHEPAWEPWGVLACLVRVDDPGKITGSHVNHAVTVSHRVGARVAFLLHEDGASLDLAAVRAILDWAAKGARAMHVLPLAVSRLQWAHHASDLLELVEETSLRGNPFDTRGRITSSSQFWNRERLVSGLLAETRAGRWSLVTGLRRFGKSSLALEVARRLTGPSAYVDLAGFHHEFAFIGDPGRAVDAVLRSLCARLVDSARSLYPQADVPEPPKAEIDAAALTGWIRVFSAECARFTDNRPPPILLILDEIEQLLHVSPERLGHVLDALAILLGRLRNAVGDSPRAGGNSSVGIILCSALHPLLWAPLRTLGQQSIIGAFPAVCVPHLANDAAAQMMRGLGARQGIRFSPEALDIIVSESQGVPLLLRRIGTSVLELYDADHARQGGLGAVQIGIEGAREALAREEREGAPLRVWVESEIAESQGPAGAMLRKLAAEGRVPTSLLRSIAERHVLAQFASSGLTNHLPQEELHRRAQEAASVMLRLLGETGLVEPIGDFTAPEAYELPDGSIRRILRSAAQRPSTESTAPAAPAPASTSTTP